MKSEKILTKEGKPYTTEKGIELVENTLEVNDTLIPVLKPIVTEKKAIVKGKEQLLKEYVLPCKVKDNEGLHGTNEKPIFVKLTPTQFKALDKFYKENGEEFNQKTYKVYEYENDFGKFLGIGTKSFKPAIDFEE